MGLHQAKKFLHNIENHQKRQPMNGRKYLQIMYLIRVLDTKYIKNSYDLLAKQQKTQLKMDR